MPVKIRGSFGSLIRPNNFADELSNHFATKYQEAVSAGDITGGYSATDLKTDLSATSNLPIHSIQTFVTFKGNGTVSILKSSNISSLTDNGTGNYTIAFTTALPDINYCVASCGQSSYSGNWGLDIWQKSGSIRSTTQFQVHCRDDGASTRDAVSLSLMFITN